MATPHLRLVPMIESGTTPTGTTVTLLFVPNPPRLSPIPGFIDPANDDRDRLMLLRHGIEALTIFLEVGPDGYYTPRELAPYVMRLRERLDTVMLHLNDEHRALGGGC